jgi:hypothetical protein
MENKLGFLVPTLQVQRLAANPRIVTYTKLVISVVPRERAGMRPGFTSLKDLNLNLISDFRRS